MIKHSVSAKSGRIKSVDGLRAIAVLSVMLFHFYYQQIAEAGKQNVTPEYFQHVLQYGNMGVYIFFVISGFIISYVTYSQLTDVKSIRLDPPFWLAVIIGVAAPAISMKVLNNDVYVPTIADIFLNIF